MSAKVEWVILYREAPGHMGGDWSETKRQYFTGTEEEAEKKVDEINRNWASVIACYPVDSSPLEKKRRQQELAEQAKREENERLQAEKRAKEIAAHKVIGETLYPVRIIQSTWLMGENSMYWPSEGDCFIVTLQRISGNMLTETKRCFELVQVAHDWFVREIEIAPDAMPYAPTGVQVEWNLKKV